MANNKTIKLITVIVAGVIALGSGGGVGGYYGMKEMAEISTEADIFRRDINVLNERMVAVEQKLDSIHDVVLIIDTKLEFLVNGY